MSDAAAIDAPQPSTSRNLGLLAIALVVTALVFARALQGDFVYDDGLTVSRNPVITSLANIPQMFARPMWEFAGARDTATVGFWRPLSTVALAIGWALGAGKPIAFHVLSLALHLAAVAVAFRLALRITKITSIAFFAALLFGVHPVHVESVAWISAINDPLSGLFALLSLDAYVAWRERGSSGSPWLAGVWLLLGLLSKEMAFAVIPMALGYDVAVLVTTKEKRDWRWVRALTPFAVTLAVYFVARAAVFGSLAAGFDRTTTSFGVSTLRSLMLRVELLGGGLKLLLAPIELKVFRPFVPQLSWAVIGWPLFMIAVWTASVTVHARRKSRAAVVAVLFAALALTPLLVNVGALGLFPLADRYLYVAVFGAVLLVSMACLRGIIPHHVGVTVLAITAALCGWQSFERTAIWKDEKTLLQTAAQESPRSPYAQWQLGRIELDEYRRTGDTQALTASNTAFLQALALGSAAQRGDTTIFVVTEDFTQSNVGLGWTEFYRAQLMEPHDYSVPETVFNMTTKRYPLSVEAWTGLGVTKTALGDLDAAEKALTTALGIDPHYVEAHRNLGELWMRRGKWSEAQREFATALAGRPDHVEYLLALAGAYENGGDDANALTQVERAATLAPNLSEPIVLRGILLARKGDLDGALAQFDRALVVRDSDGNAWLQKGKVLLARQEKNGALRCFQRACDLATDNFEAHYNAGALLLSMEGVSSAMPYLTRAYEHRPDNATGKTLRDTLLKLPIQSADTYLNLATADADRKDARGALEWLALALKIAPNDGKTLYLQGAMLKETGDRDGALRVWKRACDLLPGSLMAQESTAALLIELGDKTSARAYLERALAIAKKAEGQSPDAQAAIAELEKKLAETQ
jgi:protein O-mannosyl-transferase